VGQRGESQGLSRLDLVKHSVNTCIEVLGPDDVMAVVAFNGSATVSFAPEAMTDAGKRRARHALKELQPDGQTNIWDALRVGMELTHQPGLCRDRNVSICLLTDGEPNVNPPRGIVPTLQRTLAQTPLLGSIHAFGSAYKHDSTRGEEGREGRRGGEGHLFFSLLSCLAWACE